MVISETQSGVQEAMYKLEKYFSSCSMKVNTSKTKFMVTTGDRVQPCTITYQQNNIEQVSSFKYQIPGNWSFQGWHCVFYHEWSIQKWTKGFFQTQYQQDQVHGNNRRQGSALYHNLPTKQYWAGVFIQIPNTWELKFPRMALRLLPWMIYTEVD